LSVLFVSSHVVLRSWYNTCVEWLIMVEYTLTTLKVISGILFMLTKMTNLPSRWSLTMWWPIECLGLTILKVQPRDLAWMCILYQSCRKFIKEQKSQYGHLMKIAGTCSNRAHKSVEVLIQHLENFLSLASDLQFRGTPL
jgi:hypothetical protein